MKPWAGLALCIALGTTQSALAGEGAVKLTEGNGRELVQANCVACHSLDYIEMNAPFQKRAAWQATVNKMIKVMGATIRDEDVPAMLDYLTRQYGVD
ncbi:MAG: photosystem P840 reaction-center cytochrome c-551 [Rhodocyclaceae bacterium]|nr:photosystem P840 reaction-center cytochrome c-551 [Rhodocyclaceae bacterium]